MTYVIAPAYGVASIDNLRDELSSFNGVKVIAGNESVGYQVSATDKVLEKIKNTFDGKVTIDEFQLMKPL
ncbi:MAG: hypothetical protein ABJV04_16120 [Aliiglaciecola sp.]|uniref:hypothetical protein n=1 Tax=Aliiglaciecola sp. TaxID=1872441 RepID=UPI00329A35E0